MNKMMMEINNQLNNFDELLNIKYSAKIFYDDLIEFLYILSGADRKLTDEELKYINENLGTEFYDEKNFKTYAKNNDLDKVFKKKNPKIVDVMANQLEKNPVAASQIATILEEIKSFYNSLGTDFLGSDSKTTYNEIKIFTRYMNKLNPIIDKIIYDAKKISLYADDYDDDYDENDYEESSVDDDVSLSDYIDELNSLIGLDKVKEEINSTINLIKVRNLRSERGFTNIPMSFHMIFVGNPGTGKTTVARLVSKIYNKLGLLSNGHLVETDRSGLVAGYIGQTAIKAKEVIDGAKGGVLFIDEAYALTRSNAGNDYGIEAIDTLVKCMEDYRDDLIVIAAGYPEPMVDFVLSNPGLKSRFPKIIEFEDYNTKELLKIFESIAEKNSFRLSASAKNKIMDNLNNMDEYEKQDFGNARGIRNMFEAAVVKQATRIARIIDVSDDVLVTIEDCDI